MKFIRSIWTVLTNVVVVALAIFLGMLSIASTSFEIIVVSGMALIYTTIITYGSTMVRTQLACLNSTTNQFIYLAKLHNNTEKAEEILELEADAKEDWSEFLNKNYIYYINMFFTFVMWVIAVGSIVVSL